MILDKCLGLIEDNYEDGLSVALALFRRTDGVDERQGGINSLCLPPYAKCEAMATLQLDFHIPCGITSLSCLTVESS